MFGTYRTLLAIIVVVHHLAIVPVIGHYAVHGFFVLSGYLMTRIMHETYGYQLKGMLAFAGNRALRLYPSYFVVLLIAAAVIVLSGMGREFRPPMFLPTTPLTWLQNTTMVYWDWFPNRVEPRMSPPTWALTIELFYYLLICIGISRTKLTTFAWFLLASAFHFAAPDYEHTYFHVLSGALPFSMGALLYHFAPAPRVGHAGLIAAIGATGLLALAFSGLEKVAFYLNMTLAALTVFLLIKAEGWRDKEIGNFSYHIYLLHWPIGLVFFSAGLDRGWLLAGVSLLVSLGLSLLLTRFVDEPVEQIRRRLRN